MKYTLEKFEKETDIKNYIERYVNIPQFLGFCEECPSYGKIWSCPPFDFDPLDVWNSYSRILISGYKITYSEDRTEETMKEALFQVKEKLSEELFSLEAANPGSRSLSAGSCHVCESCPRSKGLPCMHPETMRYSIEALGGDVGRTVSELAGIEIEWIEEGRLPRHFVLCGALLIP